MNDPRPIGDFLKSVLGRPAAARQRKVDTARAAWVRIVGDDVASQTSVRSLKRGVLVIEVHSAALCHHLDSFRKTVILIQMSQLAPKVEVQDLRFRIGAR